MKNSNPLFFLTALTAQTAQTEEIMNPKCGLLTNCIQNWTVRTTTKIPIGEKKKQVRKNKG